MTLQNDISAMRTEGKDLRDRWQGLIKDITRKTGFVPDDGQAIRASTWWRTAKVGAVTLVGQIEHEDKLKPAVLKIQGTKPNISESQQIQKFQAQNNSKIIRPPQIYAHMPWDEAKEFEAIVFERINGRKVLDSPPAKDNQLSRFFEIYYEYRINCVNQPWLEKPKAYSYKKQLTNWQEAVAQQAKDNKLNLSIDQKLVDQATNILGKNLTIKDFTFQHGHLSAKDFVEADTGQVIVLSNLFWGWRTPFYDKVFAYHWHMLGMEYVKNLTPAKLVAERDKWMKYIYLTSPQPSSESGEGANTRSQIDLALLERTIAALLVDRHMLAADSSKPHLIKNQTVIVSFLMDELKRLTQQLV